MVHEYSGHSKGVSDKVGVFHTACSRCKDLDAAAAERLRIDGQKQTDRRPVGAWCWENLPRGPISITTTISLRPFFESYHDCTDMGAS